MNVDLLTREDFARCKDCAGYLARRRDVILPAINREAFVKGDDDPRPRFVRYMRGVHNRHLSGLSLETPS